MNIPRDFYQLLDVSPEADQETIRNAYLTKLKQWHPDKNPGAGADAEEMAKALNQAWETLKEPGQRKQYDRMRRFTKDKNFDDYINDEAFQQAMNRAAPVFKDLLKNARELYSLFSDAVKKRYPLNASRLGLIGGGLLYFILPADLIPDFLPLGGFLDDMSVLTMIVKSLQNELTAYRKFKGSDQDNNSA